MKHAQQLIRLNAAARPSAISPFPKPPMPSALSGRLLLAAMPPEKARLHLRRVKPDERVRLTDLALVNGDLQPVPWRTAFRQPPANVQVYRIIVPATTP